MMVIRAGSSQVSSTSKLGSRILNLFWHHSPADLLTVVTLDSVEVSSPFSSKTAKNVVIAQASNDAGSNSSSDSSELSIFTHVARLWWCPSPSLLCFTFTLATKTTNCRFIETSERVLDRFAPTRLASLTPFITDSVSMRDSNNSGDKQFQQGNTTNGFFLMNTNNLDFFNDDYDDDNDDDFFDGGNAESTSSSSSAKRISSSYVSSPFALTLQDQHHHQSRHHKHHHESSNHHHQDQKELENAQKMRSALNLSYKRRLNHARKETLDLLNAMLDAKERHCVGAAGAYSSSTDAGMRKRIEDVISLALARSALSAAESQQQSQSQENTGGASSSSSQYHQQQFKIRKQYSHNDDLLRIRAIKFAAARLNHLSLIPPQSFLGIKPDSISTTTSGRSQTYPLMNPKQNLFINYLATSSQIENALAALSVRLTIANFVDAGNCNQIVEHKALLARAIREGSISSQLTQRVFKLLLSQFATSSTNYVEQVKWILDNSLLLQHNFGTTSASASANPNMMTKGPSPAQVDDDLDDEIRETSSKKKKNKSEKKEKRERKKQHHKSAFEGYGEDEEAEEENNEEEEEDEEEHDQDDNDGSSSTSSSSNDSMQELSHSVELGFF